MKTIPLWLKLLATTFVTLVLAAMLLAWLNQRGEAPLDEATVAAATSTADLVERGAYLARAGNCAACHTARGGAPYAGGREIATPFGPVYTSNLTASKAYGLGEWNPAHFWRAMHNGRSRDGHLLNPAFPYTNFTRITRADSDALFAFLQQLPAVELPNRAHALRFPYNTQAALAVWRALYFKPAEPAALATQTTDAAGQLKERGAYLVEGLGHCAACHSARNALGASANTLAGGMVAQQNWYAPALSAALLDDSRGQDEAAFVELLHSGRNAHGAALGPMAEVVAQSTQFLRQDDLLAMAAYLKTQAAAPVVATTGANIDPTQLAALMESGAALYEKHCANCHGKDGTGAVGVYAPLAGSHRLGNTVNLVQVVRNGGFAPGTAANPRPYGMPPFAQVFGNAETAAVLTYVRNAWGNSAGVVTEAEIGR